MLVQADYLRVQDFDFVVGIEVCRSDRPYPCPVCEALAGKYPKDFKFVGCHPQCRCFIKTILKDEEELWDDIDNNTNSPSKNEVKEPPKGFNDWAKNNKERIERAEKKDNLAYFLRDNKGYVDSALGRSTVVGVKSTKHGYNSSKLGRQSTKEAIAEYQKPENSKPVILTSEQQANIKSIAKDLGIKVTPMDFFDSNEGRANVNYHRGQQYRDNCQSAVLVHEARRRGLNITAKGYSYDVDSVTYQLGEDSSLGWLNPKTNKNPQITTLRADSEKMLLSKVEKNIGVGRYSLGVNYLGNRGHIVIAERLQSGKLVIYDPQNGDFLSIGELLNEAMNVEVLKIDKLLLNKDILKAISSNL